MSTLGVGYSCHDRFPSTTTNTQQIFWTLYEVARLGCRVDLVVPAAASCADIAAHYGGDAPAIGDRLRVVGAGDPPAQRSGPPEPQPPWTMLQQARFDWRSGERLRSAAQLRSERYDVVWTRDLVAAVSCLRAGLPTLFETYRPDLASRPLFAPWRRQVLNHPNLLGVVAHSAVAARAFVSAGVAADRCLVAHNGFAPSLMHAMDKFEARARLGLPEQEKLVVYAGHVGREKGTDALVRAAAGLKGARLVLVGVEDERWSADNVIPVARVPVPDVGAYLFAADALIIPPTSAPLTRHRGTVLPMKLFAYLAAGRPIVAPRLPDIEEVLTDEESALLVDPNPPAAAAALTRVLGDQVLADRLAGHAKLLSARYTWAVRAKAIVDFVQQRLASNRA